MHVSVHHRDLILLGITDASPLASENMMYVMLERDPFTLRTLNDDDGNQCLDSSENPSILSVCQPRIKY